MPILETRKVKTELDAGRQSKQHWTISDLRQPYPVARLQQTQRKSSAAASETPRTSDRAGSHKRASDGTSRRAIRPESGADAFLVLENHALGKAMPEHSCQMPELDSRTRGRQGSSIRRIALSFSPSFHSRTMQPAETSPTSKVHTPSKRTVTHESKPVTRPTDAHVSARRPRASDSSYVAGAGEKSGGPHGGAPRARFPGNGILSRSVNPSRARRGSKALPDLPRDSSFPHGPSFAAQPQYRAADTFQNNREDVKRSQGPTASQNAPRMHSMPKESDGSSRSSFDSAEHTWNMIDNLMNAVDEDEVRRARMALSRHEENDVTKPLCAAGWPRTKSRSLFGDSASDSERDGGIDLDDVLDLLPPPRSRDGSRSRARCSSTASLYSIVIQPSNGHRPDQDAPVAHVAEEALPARIRNILQYREHHTVASSISDTSSPHEYHADICLTIEALRDARDGELEDIVFDMEDA